MKPHFPVNIKHLDAPTGIKKCICYIESKDKITKIQCPYEVSEQYEYARQICIQYV